MIFTNILSNLDILKKRLITIDEEIKIPDITIPFPKNEQDELSFLRLVAWGYVLLNESAKIHIKFFKDFKNDLNLITDIQFLRTYMAHGLSFSKDRDKETIKKSQHWFMKQCGTVNPESNEHWNKCFISLGTRIDTLIKELIECCNILEGNIDSENNLNELKKRLNKNWDAYKFDIYINNAFQRFSYQGFDPVLFRNKYLSKWREIIQLSDDSKDLDRLLQQKVEADLLTLMSYAFPYTIEELFLKELIKINPNFNLTKQNLNNDD